MQMFSRLNVCVFLGVALLLAGGTVDVHAQAASLFVRGDIGTDRVYQVNDLVEIEFIAVDGRENPVKGVTLTITHSGLTDVVISNGGTTDLIGSVTVKGTITGEPHVYIHAEWPDRQLAAQIDFNVEEALLEEEAPLEGVTADRHAQAVALGVVDVIDEDRFYAVNDTVEIVFFAITFDGGALPAHGAKLIITYSGLTDVVISNGGTIDASGGVTVTGKITAESDVYIQAEWSDKGLISRHDLRVIEDVVKQTVQAVFDKYSNTFRHPDVHEHLPDVLRAFKNPEIQNVLNPVVINHVVRDPEYIRAFYPDVDESIITLLTTDNGFRTLFEDEEFQGVLQEPAEIDELVGFIESQPQREPRMLTIVSGDLQEGSPQTPLGNPLVVLVRDQYGDALSGVDVTFRVTRGGRLSRTTARTNRIGRAETTLTLASDGIHQIEASVVGFPSLAQTFTAAATAECEVPVPSPLRPTTLNIVSGNRQSGEVGKSLAQPFVVGVLDQDGKPLQGTAVTFAVTAGNGRLSRTMATTDVYGQARTILTLGSRAGRHSVMARAAGITQPQTFTATATAPPPPKEPEPIVSVRSSTEDPLMYWIAGNTIYYRPTGGGNETFHAPQSGTLTGGLAVDMEGGKVYWTEQTIDNMGRIQSADLDATDVETVKETIAVPYDIAFDARRRRLYWTTSFGNIQSINVDGTDFRGDFHTGLETPQQIAFDVEKRRLYWTAADGIWSIYTDNDTGIRRRLDKEDLGEVGGIAVFDDVVYWTEQTSSGGRVRSMNRAGSGDKKLLAVLEESMPEGIAVDPVGGRVYWTTSRGEIQSAPFTGAIQTVVMGGDAPAIGIALGGTARVPAGLGAPSLSSVGSVENTLLANYPNPFNPETWIPYQLSASADVSVSIYAVDGCLVRRLDLGHQVSGVYRSRSRAAYWDGRNAFGERVASGLYFYTLTADDFTATRKLLIRK